MLNNLLYWLIEFKEILPCIYQYNIKKKIDTDEHPEKADIGEV